MLEPDKIPFLMKKIGETVAKNLKETLGTEDSKGDSGRWPPMRNELMEYMEPDWDELDKKANQIIATYSLIAAATNILPLGLDIVASTATFSKMATELAGVYQVIVSAKRAKQMGMAIATTTGTVLGAAYGAAYAGSRLAKLIPGAGYFVGVAIQAPMTGAIVYAAGDTLKNYFKQCRQGREPGVQSLSESFAKTLHFKIKSIKPGGKSKEGFVEVTGQPAASVATPVAPKIVDPVSDAVEKLASLHELLKSGAISQDEYDRKKMELLSKI